MKEETNKVAGFALSSGGRVHGAQEGGEPDSGTLYHSWGRGGEVQEVQSGGGQEFRMSGGEKARRYKVEEVQEVHEMVPLPVSTMKGETSMR